MRHATVVRAGPAVRATCRQGPVLELSGQPQKREKAYAFPPLFLNRPIGDQNL